MERLIRAVDGAIAELRTGHLSRRSFLSLSGAWLVGIPLTACAPSTPPPPDLATIKREWESFSPLQKIIRLESTENSPFPGFNSRNEMISAAASFYCQETKCNIAASSLAGAVRFITPEEMLKNIEIMRGRPLTEEEKNQSVKSDWRLLHRLTLLSSIKSY